MWFARERECSAPHWSPPSCFAAGRERAKETEQEIPVQPQTQSPPAPGLSLWDTQHCKSRRCGPGVLQDMARLYWAISVFHGPCKVFSFVEWGTKKLPPMPVAPRVCTLTGFEDLLAAHSFSPGHFSLTWHSSDFLIRTAPS